jgi:NADH dehydrogenase
MSIKTVCIFGGTGFVGRNITAALAQSGYRVKIATRSIESASSLRVHGDVGQISPVYCGYDDDAIAKAVRGCDLVINLVGILFQKRKKTFTKVHVDLPNKIAKACAQENVLKFIHVSALGCDQSQSKYAQSKLKGEGAVLQSFPNAVILRPSIIFGADDSFFNMFAKLSIILPFLPLIGRGKTKFQPVYVGDVAQAVCNVAKNNTDFKTKMAGKIFELGGPQVEDFKTLYQRLFEQTGRKRAFLPLSFGVAKIQAFFMGFAPNPMLTMDQVESLKTDNIVSEGALTLADLGVMATSMDIVLPTYLVCYKSGGHFRDK